jgi:hypothetical protein
MNFIAAHDPMESQMNTTTAQKRNISGDQIKVGDEISGVMFNGGTAVVKSLTPYVGSLLSVVGEGSQIAAFAGCNVEMTLPARSFYSVTNR